MANTAKKIRVRRQLVLRHVAAGNAKTQAALRRALRESGYGDVEQHTLSRDLKALGLGRSASGWSGVGEAAAVAALRALGDALRALGYIKP